MSELSAWAWSGGGVMRRCMWFAGQLKGVMRVGAFARGLLLKGECDVELILMTATKPNISLYQDLSSRLPAKFEV